MKRRLLLLTFMAGGAIALLCACHRTRVPNDVIPPDTMVQFLSEAYLLEGFYAIEANYQYAEVYPQIKTSYDSLLCKYHLTEEDFDRSIEYYVHHTELYDSIHVRAIRHLDSIANRP